MFDEKYQSSTLERRLIKALWKFFNEFRSVRGYMPIRVLRETIETKFLSHVQQHESDHNNELYKMQFLQAQRQFTNQFDYLVGTSTGGLIAFCLAVNYNILDMQKLYINFSDYFKRNILGPWLWAKYDPTPIHNKIDEIINSLEVNGKQLSADTATLLDIHNLLNPKNSISDDALGPIPLTPTNLLEFDDIKSIILTSDVDKKSFVSDYEYNHHKQREKVLIITAYNTTANRIMIFNTSCYDHLSYRIADVLKATMAAPTYFPPYKMNKWKIEDGLFQPNGPTEIFIDGGMFANDPELAALWAVRMQWKKMVNYNLISIGTGYYTEPMSILNQGGYKGWLSNGGLIINTLFEATRSFTETLANDLAKFSNLKRMKFNFKIQKYMDLDDPTFVPVFDAEWKD
ncbi:unnamed protein product, partial [Didymodactylos carnosus]